MLGTVVVVTILNLLSTVLYILSSFGNAIFLQLGWQICATWNHQLCSGEVYEAVFYISISSLISTPLQVYSMWTSINWPIAIHLTLSQLCGGFVGLSLLFIVRSVWMVRSLGILFALVAIQYILKESFSIAQNRVEKMSFSTAISSDFPKKQEPSVIELSVVASTSSTQESGSSAPFPDTNPINQEQQSSPVTVSPNRAPFTIRSGLFVWFVGLSAGLLGGLFGTPGPPLMIYVTRSSMTKDEVRGTLAVSYFFLTVERLLMIALLPSSPIRITSTLSLYAILGIFVSSIAGRYVGNFMSKYVDEVLFRRIIMGILGFGSISMMTSGVSLVFRLIAYVLFMLLFGAIGYIAYLYQVRKLISNHDPDRQFTCDTSQLAANWRKFHKLVTPHYASYEYFEEKT